MWRARYEEFGLAGLEDEERPGRPVIYDHDDVLLVGQAGHRGSSRRNDALDDGGLAHAMAEHGVPISASQAWRICKALDLKPWQVESWMTSHDPDFWAKASDVCGLYLNPPHNAVVWSVDEKSGMQAKSRINPSKPAIPGKRPARVRVQAPRDRRALRRAQCPRGHSGGMGDELDQERQLRHLLGRPGGSEPPQLDLHCIADNFAAHKTAKVTEFLAANPRVHIHHTPIHASWLNQVELFFSILERRVLRRGEFNSTDDLAAKVIAFINDYNRRAAPFRWTYDGKPLRVA